jgi:hypothetical protein
MMLFKIYDDNSVYIAFGVDLYNPNEFIIPEKLREWLETIDGKEWAMFEDKIGGVYLRGEDAVAFRLKFDIMTT